MSYTPKPWSIWFRHYAPFQGLWIEIHTNRRMRPKDVEMIRKHCDIWQQIAEEDEAAEAHPAAPSSRKEPADG